MKPPAGLASDLGNAEYEVLLYEYKADLEAYFAGIPGAPVKTLADLIAFNERNKEREMPYFGQEILTLAAAKGPLTTPAYRTALAKCRRMARTEGIDAMMTAHRLDALFAPTGTPAWVTDLVNGDSVGGGSSTLAAVAGYPAHHGARGLRDGTADRACRSSAAPGASRCCCGSRTPSSSRRRRAGLRSICRLPPCRRLLAASC